VPPRNRWFADSPLEGDGFELFVPRHESPEFRNIPGIADSSSTGYDREAFRSIHCLPQSLGDDDSDRLAAVAGFSDCQNRVRRDEERGAVVATQRHLVRVRRHGPVRDRLQAVLRRVAADQDRENARRTDPRSDVDADDPRMRVRRADQLGIGLARQVHVIGVPARPSQKAHVLAPPKRFADPCGAIWCRESTKDIDLPHRSHCRYTAARPWRSSMVKE